MKRLSLALALLAALTALASADSGPGKTSLELQADYKFPNHAAVDSSGFAPIDYSVYNEASATERNVGSTWGGGELKAILDYKLAFPALVGDGPLTSGNNLSLDFAGEVSPVSLNANAQVTLTPIAFLKFAAGVGIGTGWDIGFIGLAMNNAGVLDIQNFGGCIYRAWVEGTFQFDLAALMPGDWNHIVVLASPKIQYQAYSRASDSQAWLWEADDGMNFNGLKLTGSYFLGYQMPIALETVGLLLQPEGWLGSVRDMAPSDGSKALKWGSDFTYLTFGPLFDLRIDGGSSIAILPQFKTGIKWTDTTTMRLNFQQRVYEAPFVYFYRVAFDYTLKL